MHRACPALANVCVIGGGLAGVTCARSAARRGHDVTLLEAAPSLGGRLGMGAHGWQSVPADDSCIYFSAKSATFRDQVALWKESGKVETWRLTQAIIDAESPMLGNTVKPTALEHRDVLVGTPRMAAICGAFEAVYDGKEYQPTSLADGLATFCVGAPVASAETSDDGGGCTVHLTSGAAAPFDAVAFAVPFQEAVRLCSEAQDLDGVPALLEEEQKRKARFAATFSFEVSLGLPFTVAAVTSSPITMMVNDSSRPGRAPLPEMWVVQTDVQWAVERGALAYQGRQADDVGSELLSEFERVLGFSPPPPLDTNCTAWAYSGNYLRGSTNAYVWDATKRIGLCGDWLMDGRVEGAFLSGNALATAVADSLEQT